MIEVATVDCRSDTKALGPYAGSTPEVLGKPSEETRLLRNEGEYICISPIACCACESWVTANSSKSSGRGGVMIVSSVNLVNTAEISGLASHPRSMATPVMSTSRSFPSLPRPLVPLAPSNRHSCVDS